MTTRQKDKFAWDDRAVEEIINDYPAQVTDRLRELHPTSTVVYYAYDQVTRHRRAEGYGVTANPTLREVAAYIGRAFSVQMQFGNIYNNHLPGLLEVGLLHREKALDGSSIPRGITVVDPNELKPYSAPIARSPRDKPENSVWADLHRPTVFEVAKDGDLTQVGR